MIARGHCAKPSVREGELDVDPLSLFKAFAGYAVLATKCWRSSAGFVLVRARCSVSKMSRRVRDAPKASPEKRNLSCARSSSWSRASDPGVRKNFSFLPTRSIPSSRTTRVSRIRRGVPETRRFWRCDDLQRGSGQAGSEIGPMVGFKVVTRDSQAFCRRRRLGSRQAGARFSDPPGGGTPPLSGTNSCCTRRVRQRHTLEQSVSVIARQNIPSEIATAVFTPRFS
jgi:hypothetical protein